MAETAQRYRKYCGIDFRICDKDKTENPFDIINGEIAKNNPMMFSIDVFHCPWTEQYHNWHSDHYCTITGIDDKNIYCMDTNPVEQNGIISRQEFSKGYKSIITFEFGKTNEDFSDLKAVMRTVIKGLGGKTFDNLRFFADCFEKMNLAVEINGISNIWNIPIFSKILSICGSRCQFQKFIEYLMKYFDDDILRYLLCQFSDISIQWNSIKDLTCKAVIAKDERALPDISERIRAAAGKEEDTAERINDYLNNKFVFEPKK